MSEVLISRCIAVLLLLVAVIHLMPLAGVLGVPRLSALYDVAIDGAEMEILMRHRAVLFGLLGGFLAIAALRPSLQPLALTGGLVSVGSFLWLAISVGQYNDAIRRVVIADVIALAALLLAGAMLWLRARG